MNENVVIAPDGGWGWMIAVAAFMVNFIIDGVIGCFGLIYPDLERQFAAGPSLTSMAGSLIVGVYMCCSLLVGGLIQRYGCRRISIIGGCIGAVGCCISMFSQNLATFMLLYGVIAGIGFSMNSLSGHLMINTYFNRRRGLANGIALSGAGVGVFLMSPLIQFCLVEYGWRGTMLVSGGIVLNFCVCGALLRPLNSEKYPIISKTDNALSYGDKTTFTTSDTLTGTEDVGSDQPTSGGDIPLISHGYHSSKRTYLQKQPKFLTPDLQRKSNKPELAKTRTLNDKDIMDTHSLPDLKHIHLSSTDDFTIKTKVNSHLQHDPFRRKDIFYSGSLYHLKEFKESHNMAEFIDSMTICDKDEVDCHESVTNKKYLIASFKQLCDTSVFKNRLFIPVFIGAIGIQMSQFIPNTFIKAYCITVDLSETQISIILSIFGALNILGRLSAGCLANLSFINTLWLFNFGVFMCGVACSVFPLCTTFPTVSIFSASLGYFMGYFPPLQIVVLVEYIGIEKLTSSLGFVQLAKGFSAVAGPPLAGMIYEWTKSYSTSIQFAGILSFIAVLAQSLVPVLDRISKRKKRKSETNLKNENQLPETKQMLSDLS